MPDTYTYKVRDRRGTLITGEIVGESQDLVLAKLREQRYIPLEVKAKSGGLKREFHLLPQKAKLKDLAVFSRQFATMVNSGLPLLRTLSILEDQTDSKVLAKKVGEVRLDVERGSCLSGALARHERDRKSTRLNSSHLVISYAVFCLKKKNTYPAPPLRGGPARLSNV